jgi:hypothetical protein
MNRSLFTFSILLALSFGSASADFLAKKMTGTWYEADFGEQTVWIDQDGRCKFNRGQITLFGPSTCQWNTKGEIILTYKGSQSKVFMRPNGSTLLMAQNPALLSKFNAETILTRSDDPHGASTQHQKPLRGEWEARDHSMHLSLMEKDQCAYSKGSSKIFSRSQCNWSAGKEGATLIFTDPEHSGHNTALFVKLFANRLLADTDKGNLLPSRAKMQMVRDTAKTK